MENIYLFKGTEELIIHNKIDSIVRMAKVPSFNKTIEKSEAIDIDDSTDFEFAEFNDFHLQNTMFIDYKNFNENLNLDRKFSYIIEEATFTELPDEQGVMHPVCQIQLYGVSRSIISLVLTLSSLICCF